ADGVSRALPATLATRPRNPEPGRTAISSARNFVTGVSAGGQMKGLRFRTNGRSSGGGRESIRTSHGTAQTVKIAARLFAGDTQFPRSSDSTAAATACTAKTQ